MPAVFLAVLVLAAIAVQDAFAGPGRGHSAPRGDSDTRLVKGPNARASQSDQAVIAMLARIAAHQTHGWSGDTLPISELESVVAAGGRIVVSCGTVAKIGVDAARQAGYEARRVGSFTRQPLNNYDDGHILMEVRLSAGWTVFDLDNNRMAPLGVGIAELVDHPNRWGRTIARDPQYDAAEVAADPYPEYDRYMFAHLDVWYRRVLGVATIEAEDGSYLFHDAAQRERGLSLGYHWAGGRYWNKLSS